VPRRSVRSASVCEGGTSSTDRERAHQSCLAGGRRSEIYPLARSRTWAVKRTSDILEYAMLSADGSSRVYCVALVQSASVTVFNYPRRSRRIHISTSRLPVDNEPSPSRRATFWCCGAHIRSRQELRGQAADFPPLSIRSMCSDLFAGLRPTSAVTGSVGQYGLSARKSADRRGATVLAQFVDVHRSRSWCSHICSWTDIRRRAETRF